MLELFAGTRRMADAFEELGWETYTLEIDRQFPRIDLYEDILKVDLWDIIINFGLPDVIWASPVCTTYSVAGIGHHRIKAPDNSLEAISDAAKLGDKLVIHTLNLIADLQPKYFFIENPRGGLRKMKFMRGLPRHTITYCQYNDFRMKPTDIWTNHPDPKFKPPCNNGDSCHESAPRGSRTGTERFNNPIDKAKIPYDLCKHIAEICSNN